MFAITSVAVTVQVAEPVGPASAAVCNQTFYFKGRSYPIPVPPARAVSLGYNNWVCGNGMDNCDSSPTWTKKRYNQSSSSSLTFNLYQGSGCSHNSSLPDFPGTAFAACQNLSGGSRYANCYIMLS
jgi:hypothetical protein